MSDEKTQKIVEVTPNTAHAGGANSIEKDHGGEIPNKEFKITESQAWEARAKGIELEKIPKEYTVNNELLAAYKDGATQTANELDYSLRSVDANGRPLEGHGSNSVELSSENRKQTEAELKTAKERIENIDSMIKKNNDRIAEIADDRFPDYKPGDLKDMIPPRIEKEYVKVGEKFHYGFKPDLEAFHDKGNALETKSAGQTVTKDLIDIAAARGWEKINVKGSEEFKRQVWLEASMRNIDVRGFKPTDADLAQLAKAKEGKTQADQSKAKDATPNAPKGAHSLEKEKADALRSGDRSAAVKRFPELINAFALVKAAELLAEKRIQNPEGKEAFVSSVKESLASQVERGEKIPEVQYRGREAEAEMSQSR